MTLDNTDLLYVFPHAVHTLGVCDPVSLVSLCPELPEFDPNSETRAGSVMKVVSSSATLESTSEFLRGDSTARMCDDISIILDATSADCSESDERAGGISLEVGDPPGASLTSSQESKRMRHLAR